MNGTWVRRPEGDTTVVFVHGILSNGAECWRNDVTNSYWPQIVAQDDQLTGVGVYVYDYLTGIDSGTYSVRDAGNDLHSRMRLDNVNSTRLAFVCHSLGGIVVRKSLVDHRTEFIDRNQEILLFLVASPSLGSQWATRLLPLISLVGNEQAMALKSVQREGEFLETVDLDFMNLKEQGRLKITGMELIEDRPLVGRRLSARWIRPIVEPLSGRRYFGDPFKVPGSDHSSIAKPADENADQHRLLRELLLRDAERRPAQQFPSRVERERLLAILAEDSHVLRSALADAVLLNEEVTSVMGSLGEKQDPRHVDWAALSAEADTATLIRLVQVGPDSSERLKQELVEVATTLQAISELGDSSRSSQSAPLRDANVAVKAAIDRLAAMRAPAEKAYTAIRFMRNGRWWNGTAVVDDAGSAYYVAPSDFTDTAELAAWSRRAAESVIDALESLGKDDTA